MWRISRKWAITCTFLRQRTKWIWIKKARIRLKTICHTTKSKVEQSISKTMNIMREKTTKRRPLSSLRRKLPLWALPIKPAQEKPLSGLKKYHHGTMLSVRPAEPLHRSIPNLVSTSLIVQLTLQAIFWSDVWKIQGLTGSLTAAFRHKAIIFRVDGIIWAGANKNHLLSPIYLKIMTFTREVILNSR